MKVFAHTPLAIKLKKFTECALLTTPDYHPTQMSFGKFELITAPTRFCAPEPVLVNTSLTQSKPLQINWLETAKPIEMVDESKEHTFITSSTLVYVNMIEVMLLISKLTLLVDGAINSKRQNSYDAQKRLICNRQRAKAGE